MPLLIECCDRQILQICFCFETDTAVSEIEEAFRGFVSRDDVAIVLINQHVCTSAFVCLCVKRFAFDFAQKCLVASESCTSLRRLKRVELHLAEDPCCLATCDPEKHELPS